MVEEVEIVLEQEKNREGKKAGGEYDGWGLM